MLRFLLVNLNNTSTKLALADEQQLLKKEVIPTAKLSRKKVQEFCEGWPHDRVVLGSVVPRKTSLFRRLAGGTLLEVSADLDLGIGLDLPQPVRVGADRLANAVAVVHRHGAPAIVIDFGTAATFDAISDHGNYLGGVIAPGLGVMTDYLYERTALLPRIDLTEPVSPIGKTTKAAMLAGAVLGYRGLVREIVAELVKHLGGEPQIVATGTYAALIAARLPVLQIVDPELTLEGLRIIALRNR